MRSIRLSLTVYIVALLAVALAGAALLVERTASKTLEGRRDAGGRLIEAQYQERCRAEETRRDEALLFQAQTLARLTQFQYDRNRLRNRELHALGVLSVVHAPSAWAVAPSWAAQAVRGPFFFDIHRQQQFTTITLNSSDLLREVDDQVAEYFQIDGDWGSSYHSASLGSRRFPAPAVPFAPDQLVYWEWDDTRLDAQTPVRRVRLKASAVRQVRLDSGAPQPRREIPGPTILVQCAYDSRKLDGALEEFNKRRASELAELDADTDATLAELRHVLLLLAAVIFAAAVLGDWGLVRLGLAPLQRLSDAVSRVSPRDFRLPLEGPLPRELAPIADRLRSTLGQLRRAFAREKQATAALSHELRTPLAAVLATADLALRKPRSPEEYREFLRECRQSAQHIYAIAERLLELARLDAGVETVQLGSVDATLVAEQTIGVVRPLADARGVRLQVHCPADPEAARVMADRNKLREVLINLLHNAVQYNRPAGADGGGTVDLTIGRDNGEVVLVVRDTGIGIAPEAREHIFERFYRADPSRTGDGLHAGLGLALVREYVERMGGTVTVQSAPGQGSTFEVRLPADPYASPGKGR
jgi:signal transduction histidine kinase